MGAPEFIATRLIRVVRTNGEELEVSLAIGAPRQEPTGEWACPLSAAPLYERAYVRGADAMQSLVLALRMMRLVLETEVGRGAQLFCGGDRFELDDLF